jgi:hypothetical protein
MQNLTGEIIVFQFYNTKANCSSFLEIGEIDETYIKNIIKEIGDPSSWPTTIRDENKKLANCKSLILRELNHIDLPLRAKYPSIEPILSKVQNLGYGYSFGKIVIANLKPWGEILPHYDRGDYYKYHNRIHVPLITNENVVFNVGTEKFKMKSGKVYLFQNLVHHSVKNQSENNRVHIVIDVLDQRYHAELYKKYYILLTANQLKLIGILYRFMRYLFSITKVSNR